MECSLSFKTCFASQHRAFHVLPKWSVAFRLRPVLHPSTVRSCFASKHPTLHVLAVLAR